jgi:hypothetical protein
MRKFQKSKKSKVGNRKAGSRTMEGSGMSFPPPYKQQTIRHWKIRCIVTGGQVLQAFTGQQLASLLGIFATGATTSFQFATQFRLAKVEMWDIPNAIGNTVTLGLKWADNPLAASIGIANPPVSVSDSSDSLDRYAHVVLRPQKDSYSNNWFASNTLQNLLLISTGANSGTCLADFDFEFVIDDIGSLNAGPTLAAATAGTFYHKIITSSGGLTLTPVNTLNSI